jgi:hypothetical protein
MNRIAAHAKITFNVTAEIYAENENFQNQSKCYWSY